MNESILLVRHGSHDEVGLVLSGRNEIGLNAAGLHEVAVLRDALAGLPVAAIHSSPRPRARETAAILAAPLNRPVVTAEAMDEIDFGSWTGRSFAELDGDPDWHRWNAARASARPPRGETMGAVVDRAWAYLRSSRGTVLVVSHCDVIRGVVAAALGLSLDRLLAFDCDPASITRLVRDGGGFRVAGLNLNLLPDWGFARGESTYYPGQGSQPGAAA